MEPVQAALPNLSGLRVSTRDLLGVLLISLPNLKELELTSIDLTDGKWIHINEGLRTQSSLERCTLWGNTLWTDCYSGPHIAAIDKAHRRSLARVLRAFNEIYTLYKHECESKDRCSRIVGQIRDILRTDITSGGEMESSEEDDDEVDDDDDDDEEDEEENDYDDGEYGGYFDMDGWESNDENIMAAIMQSSRRDTSSDDETE